ncbi:hypothetical protein [Bacteroides acidifaciens]|uniref:hypothetical protein n=1 Tax=Bacteroides acidifaciens TaxID=85831 RepID=UPI0025A941EA|nr:hypothetical protein [Bacteroides acidifaciens]
MENNIQSILDRDERISRYLKGLMSIQEETKFLADMESDEQLKQDAIAQARLVKGMTQVDYELIQELKNTPKAKLTSSLRPPRIIFRKPVTWLSVAASVLVLLFAGYKGYDYYDTTRLGMKYATAFPMETLVRGDTDSNVDKELQTLFENVVERKDLSTTTKRLSELWEISNQETYNDYTDYASYIGWYLAIGYLEDYEKDKALCVLHTMLEDDNVSLSVKDQINELLKRL